LLTAPPPHARDKWIPLRHLAVNWALSLDGMTQDALAARLFTAAENGEVPASALRIAQDGRSDGIEHVGGLRGLIERAAAQGISRLEFASDLVEERHLTLIFHRDGVLTFAELYGYAPPPWWAAAPRKSAQPRTPGQRGQKAEKRPAVIAKMRAWAAENGWDALDRLSKPAMASYFGAGETTCWEARIELLRETPTELRQNSDKSPTRKN
jgi:hypothetical protein